MKEIYKKRVSSSQTSFVLAAIIPMIKQLPDGNLFPLVLLRNDESLHSLCFRSDMEIFCLDAALSGADPPAIWGFLRCFCSLIPREGKEACPSMEYRACFL